VENGFSTEVRPAVNPNIKPILQVKRKLEIVVALSEQKGATIGEFYRQAEQTLQEMEDQ